MIEFFISHMNGVSFSVNMTGHKKNICIYLYPTFSSNSFNYDHASQQVENKNN